MKTIHFYKFPSIKMFDLDQIDGGGVLFLVHIINNTFFFMFHAKTHLERVQN